MYKMKLTNPIVREMVIKRLFELGARTRTCNSYNKFLKAWPRQDEWVYCFVDSNGRFDSWSEMAGNWLDEEVRNYPTLSLDELFSEKFSLNLDKVIKVPLNAQYTAEVSKNGVKVGCTTFDLKVIDKLIKARTQLNPIDEDELL